MLNDQNLESRTLAVCKSYLDIEILRSMWLWYEGRMLSSLVADCSPKCPESSESHEGGSNIRPKHKHETRRHVRQRNKGEAMMRSLWACKVWLKQIQLSRTLSICCWVFPHSDPDWVSLKSVNKLNLLPGITLVPIIQKIPPDNSFVAERATCQGELD